MKLELFVFGITAFLVFNTYYDGKYLKVFHSWQKEIKMSTFAFVGLSLYIFLKKNPGQTQSMLSHANDIIRYMPISRSSADMLSPFLDFANKKSLFQEGDNFNLAQQQQPQSQQQQQQPQNAREAQMAARLMASGRNNATKRSVSETKKKFVAAQQSWKCGHCDRQLPAWYEVDHIVRLEHGGSNNVDNLVALCRDCHGKKNRYGNVLKKNKKREERREKRERRHAFRTF
jgi:5-methylcytosine-specific restriction endonuclease McrA